MQKHYSIKLSAHDLGQLLDGLRFRAESWQKTAKFLAGHVPDEPFICEECRDLQEAESIAQHYIRIVTEIERQFKKQGDWS